MRQHAAENLFQTIPPLYPSSPFPSIDYVTKPFADILDTIALVMVLWTTAAIVNRLMTIPFGRNTRTVLLQRMFDNLTNLRFPTSHCFKAQARRNHWLFSFSSILFRLIATSFFLVLGGVEVAVIYSQTFQQKARSLDDLNLKGITFQIPQNGEDLTGYFRGCVPLLSGERTSTSLVFTLCMYQEFANEETAAELSGFEFQFTSSDPRFFDIYEAVSTIDLRSRISVEIRDPRRSALYFANMSRLGFSMTSSKLEWLSRQLKENCTSCEVSAEYVSPTFSVLRSSSNPVIDRENRVDMAIRFSNYVQSMIRLSNRKLKSSDFLSEDAQDDKSELGLLEVSVGRVKRVSGLTLWIVLAALAIINFVSSRLTYDIDDDVNGIVAAALAYPPETSLLDYENTRFSIVDTHLPSIQREKSSETGQRTSKRGMLIGC